LSLKAIDFTGAILLLATLVLLITGFEEAASLLTWTTGSVLGPICVSVLTCVAFLASQWHASRAVSSKQPVFPWKFVKNRIVFGLFL
jgi:hypothetical protein